jgi:hypothetical protein
MMNEDAAKRIAIAKDLASVGHQHSDGISLALELLEHAQDQVAREGLGAAEAAFRGTLDRLSGYAPK